MEGIELPVGGELTPEAVDALADQMLHRLAVTEKAVSVLDPEDLPGGKWGFTAGLMAVIVVAMVAIATVIGFIISR